MLPTLSGELRSGSSTEVVRVFRDGGCQLNFVCGSLVHRRQFDTVEVNVLLTIHGFNSSRTVRSKVVRFPLFIGNDPHFIDALVVPRISTSFKVKNLDIITKSFIKKGYVLADRALHGLSSGTVDNIQIIIGNDSDYILPMTYICFGNKPVRSAYIDSPAGLILTGNLTRMANNLSHLPSINEENSISSQCIAVSCDHKYVVNSDVTSENEVINDSMTFEVESPPSNIESTSMFSVFDEVGEIIDSKLDEATSEALDRQYHYVMNIDVPIPDKLETETNNKLVSYVLDNTSRDVDNRLVMPLMWNAKNVHMLGRNYNLARCILKSNLKKLTRNDTHLKMYHEVFAEQEELGIIEKIPNLSQFLDEHPEASFLSHMGVFRMSNDTTRCRVVFLSSLHENDKDKIAVSHNQAMLPGPCLNHKMITATMMLRFDKYILLFDIVKAFLNIVLRELDSNRLLFLWFRDPLNNDFSIVGYRNLRLSFGLRPSPATLMLALYKILMLDNEGQSERIISLKRSIFNAVYMDNGLISENSLDNLRESYALLDEIFPPYKFQLQKYCTNNMNLL